MSRRPELKIVNGPLAGKRFAIKEGGLRLGWSSSNDIHVPDGELSRNHCLFERVGDDGLRVTDLASANGTVLNGSPLGNDPADLRIGDVIEVGSTVVHVVGDEPSAAPAAASVDLGFGPGGPAQPSAPAARRRRSPFANILWAFALVLVSAAAYLALNWGGADESAQPAVAAVEEPTVVEINYEKVEATDKGIFRFELTLSRDGVLRVAVDDVPDANRHLTKSLPLGEAARKTLNEILEFKTVKEIDREYVGVEPDPPALSSRTLKVVYTARARMIRVVNTQEPEAFRALREKLETFAKNELGVWAMQYSRDSLVKLAEESLQLARSKFEDRDVNYGNLFAAVAAYRESIFYLETVNPKPPCHPEAVKGLEAAVRELDRRYADQRFLADRACNLGQWETARRELGVLLEMVPDRADDRNREATAKLLDVDKRLQKGGK